MGQHTPPPHIRSCVMLVVTFLGRTPMQDLKPDVKQTMLANTQQVGATLTQVDDATAHEGSTVVDPACDR